MVILRLLGIISQIKLKSTGSVKNCCICPCSVYQLFSVYPNLRQVCKLTAFNWWSSGTQSTDVYRRMDWSFLTVWLYITIDLTWNLLHSLQDFLAYTSNIYVEKNSLCTSDSMVQPQMDWDRLRNVSNLVLVEPNQIRDLLYACIRLVFANFLSLKCHTHAPTVQLLPFVWLM